MLKKRTRIFSAVLALILSIGLLPAIGVRAADKGVIVFSTENEDGVLTQEEVTDQLVAAGMFPLVDTFSAAFDGSVTGIGSYAFSGACYELISVAIPDWITSISSYSFFGCFNITSIFIPEGVSTIGYRAFLSCSKLTEINVSPDNAVYSSFHGAVYNKAMTTLIIWPEGVSVASSFPDSMTSIGDYAFYGSGLLTSVVIPDRVTSIGVGAFLKCELLTDVVIGANVMSIGVSAFEGCLRLEDVVIPEGVTNINNLTFYDCTNLSHIVLPNGMVSIGNYAFYSCTALSSIEIPDSVTNIGLSAFGFCDSLTSIELPASISGTGIFSFQNCTGLMSVVMPNGMTRIDDQSFNGCSSLTEVVIPDSVTSIGNNAFDGCTNLTSVVIGKSVRTMQSNVFKDTQIQTITLPPSVSEFISPTGTFKDMPALENIVFEPGTTAIAAKTFLDITAPVKAFMPKSVTTINPNSGLGANTTVYAFAGSDAETFADENGIPYVTMPTVLADELPKGYQFLPYSFSFASSVDSWLAVTQGVLPDGMEIAVTADAKRMQGEIFGAPRQSGTFEVSVRATDGNVYPLLDDEVTFTIEIEPYKTPAWMSVLNDNLIDTHLGDYYDAAEQIYVVELLDPDPEDKVIVFGCGFGDFIDLWIDGELQTRDVDGSGSGDYFVEEGSTIVIVYGKTLAKVNEANPKADHVIAGEFKIGGQSSGEQYKAAQPFRINVVPRVPDESPSSPSLPRPNSPPVTPRPISPSATTPNVPNNTIPDSENIPAIPLPMEQPRRTTVIIYADVALDGTGTVANATVSDDEVLDAAEEVVQAAAEAGTESGIIIRIDAPQSAAAFDLALSDVSVAALADNGVDALIVEAPRLGTMTMVSPTIAAMNNARGNGNVQIALRHLSDTPEALNVRQREAKGGDPAFAVTIRAGSANLSDLGGTMNIELPYTLRNGQRAGGIFVYHLAEDGGTTVMPSQYKESERAVTFDTTHLSVYAIGYSAAAASSPAMPYTGGVDMTIWMMVFGALLTLPGFTLRRKRLRERGVAA